MGISGISGSSGGAKVDSSVTKLSSKLSDGGVGSCGGANTRSAFSFSLSSRSCSRFAAVCSSFSFVISPTFLTGFLIAEKRPSKVVPVSSIATTTARITRVMHAPVLPKALPTSPPKTAPITPPETECHSSLTC